MDSGLSKLIKDYLSTVLQAVELLRQAGHPIPGSAAEWACNGMPNVGLLPGGVKYRKHGYGCAVHLEPKIVDFDFGKEGQTNGFNAWRLEAFAGDDLGEYGFNSARELAASFEEAVAHGSLRYSGYILYDLADESDRPVVH